MRAMRGSSPTLFNSLPRDLSSSSQVPFAPLLQQHAMAASGAFPIYWEKQESALCGTHCLNNLLQGPYYDEQQMAAIAHALDERERQLMSEGGVDSASFLASMAADSSNVDDSGNFSIEVLSTCLRNTGLECINTANPALADVRNSPALQTGFICNHQSHWLALRKLHGEWFNLNSLQSESEGWGPAHLSDLYLSTLLATLRNRGYSIFVVQGSFPPVDTSAADLGASGRGSWYSSAEVMQATREGFKRQKRQHLSSSEAKVAELMKPGGPAAGDRQLAEALARSMTEQVSGGSSSASAALQRKPPSPLASTAVVSPNSDFDDDLARALALSMEPQQRPSASPPAAAAATVAPAAAAASPPAAAAASAAPAEPPKISAREAAAAAALKRVAASMAASAAAVQPANVAVQAPAASSAAAAAPASVADSGATATPASSAAGPAAGESTAPAAAAPAEPGPSAAADDGLDEDEREQLRLAMEMSMQQAPAE